MKKSMMQKLLAVTLTAGLFFTMLPSNTLHADEVIPEETSVSDTAEDSEDTTLATDKNTKDKKEKKSKKKAENSEILTKTLNLKVGDTFGIHPYNATIKGLLSDAGIDTSEWYGVYTKDDVKIEKKYFKFGRVWELYDATSLESLYKGFYSEGDTDDLYQKYFVNLETQYDGKTVFAIEEAEGIGEPSLKALKPGKTTITIKALKAGEQTYTVKIPVKITAAKKQQNKITAEKKSYTKKSSKKKQTLQLKVKAKGGKVTYKSDSDQVTVSKNGKVTIKKGFSGTAKITVTAGDDEFESVKKTITITVE